MYDIINQISKFQSVGHRYVGNHNTMERQINLVSSIFFFVGTYGLAGLFSLIVAIRQPMELAIKVEIKNKLKCSCQRPCIPWQNADVWSVA